MEILCGVWAALGATRMYNFLDLYVESSTKWTSGKRLIPQRTTLAWAQIGPLKNAEDSHAAT